MSCSEAGARKGGQEERGERDVGMMDWGPLRPPNSKASRKSCQSALSLSQSVQVAQVQGTWSDTTQKTHTPESQNKKAQTVLPTILMNHLVSFNVILLKHKIAVFLREV